LYVLWNTNKTFRVKFSLLIPKTLFLKFGYPLCLWTTFGRILRHITLVLAIRGLPYDLKPLFGNHENDRAQDFKIGLIFSFLAQIKAPKPELLPTWSGSKKRVSVVNSAENLDLIRRCFNSWNISRSGSSRGYCDY